MSPIFIVSEVAAPEAASFVSTTLSAIRLDLRACSHTTRVEPEGGLMKIDRLFSQHFCCANGESLSAAAE